MKMFIWYVQPPPFHIAKCGTGLASWWKTCTLCLMSDDITDLVLPTLCIWLDYRWFSALFLCVV